MEVEQENVEQVVSEDAVDMSHAMPAQMFGLTKDTVTKILLIGFR
jgi:hypothetical protein